MHLLLVCRANVCRSPIAEHLCRQAIQEGELPSDWTVGSAGTWVKSRRPIHPDARRLLEAYGVDPAEHESREINERLISTGDLVLTMEAHQQEAIEAEFSEFADRIHMLSELDGKRTDVDDPVMTDGVTFRETFDTIRSYLDGCEEAVKRLCSKRE